VHITTNSTVVYCATRLSNQIPATAAAKSQIPNLPTMPHPRRRAGSARLKRTHLVTDVAQHRRKELEALIQVVMTLGHQCIVMT
jgi:hypothetical protein